MRIYPNTAVELTVQPLGSNWLGILRGKSRDVNLVFNGLFNYMATSGELHSELPGIFTFWTSRAAMQKFFENLYCIPRYIGEHDAGNAALTAASKAYALERMAALENETEIFWAKPTVDYRTYSMGDMAAEKPDGDFRDAVLAHAFAGHEKFSKKSVDNSAEI